MVNMGTVPERLVDFDVRRLLVECVAILSGKAFKPARFADSSKLPVADLGSEHARSQ